MKRIVIIFLGLTLCLAATNSFGQSKAAFFRVRAEASTQITSFCGDGTLVWSNVADVGVTCTVQRATRLRGSGNWADFSTLNVTNATMALKVFDPSPPEGKLWIPVGMNNGTDPKAIAPYMLEGAGFYMDRTEVTLAQWNDVYTWATANDYVFDNPGDGKALDHPVHTVSWSDCVTWCNARSEKEGRQPCYEYDDVSGEWTCDFSASGYRLPMSEEWKYAARGGTNSRRFPWGDTITHEQANYYADPLQLDYDLAEKGYHPTYETGEEPYTSPAGSFEANGYGLHDMAGNVWEWCWDIFILEDDTTGRCFRGGSYFSDADEVLCSSEASWDTEEIWDDLGFRTVCQ